MFASILVQGCVAWNLGKVGYLEPGVDTVKNESNFIIGEKCMTIMGKPFIEEAIQNSNLKIIKNATIRIENNGFGACYRIYPNNNSKSESFTSINLGNFKTISINPPETNNFMKKDFVKGEDCRYISLINLFSRPSLERAVYDSLRNVDGAIGLENATIYNYRNVAFLLVIKYCYLVEGVAVK